MAQLYTPQQLGIKAPSGGFQQGGWYSGRQYWGGQFSDPGVINPLSNQQGAGQAVSQEVVKQTNPNNVSFIQQQHQVQANQLSAPVNVAPTTSSAPAINTQVDSYRRQLEQEITTRKTEAESKLAELRAKEQEILGTVGELTQPFREELENAERERLYINQNFEANQKLVDELDQLLTEGNNLIKQQQEVTGLASVRNPRIQKTMMDVQARAGVIEAVINARNGQIGQAQNLIDRSINAIAADRQDQINYYSTILDLNRRDILTLDNQSQTMALKQIEMLENDLINARETENMIKRLLLDPTTAELVGSAGVTLNDSVDTINKKMAQAQYYKTLRDEHNSFIINGYQPVVDTASVPKNQLVSFTDSQGKVHYYRKPIQTSASGFNQNTFFNSIAAAQQASQQMDPDYLNFLLVEENNPILEYRPRFIPVGGPGTMYTDPQTGYTWKHTNDGWQFIR